MSRERDLRRKRKLKKTRGQESKKKELSQERKKENGKEMTSQGHEMSRKSVTTKR
jgi:hypothetical protein